MNGNFLWQKQEDRKKGPSVRNWLCSTSIIVLIGAIAPTAVLAQEWTGAVSDDWDTGGNWQGGTKPTASTDVLINSEGTGWPRINGTTQTSRTLTIGNTAPGGSLTIVNGGELTTGQGAIVGDNFAGSARVTGTNSAWDIGADLTVGYAGSGNFTVTNNAQASSEDGYLGRMATGVGVADVFNGAQWDISRDLVIGYEGQGTLNIDTGGSVSTTATTTLGYSAGSQGSIDQDGGFSTFSTGLLVVGRDGVGNVYVQDPGTITSASAILGQNSGSTGTVSLNHGSQWNNATDLTVGAAGAGTLSVLNNSQLTSQTVTVSSAGGTGEISVTQGGSIDTQNLVLAASGSGSATVNLSAAGTILTTHTAIGSLAGTSGTITVTGDQTQLSATGDLLVGVDGQGTLLVEDKGRVDTANLFIGQGTGNGSVTVSTEAVVTTTNLRVGDAGSATLVIDSGGSLISNGGHIGFTNGSSGTVLVTGNGSQWDAGGTALRVGGLGTGTLRVENGGTVLGSVDVLDGGTLRGNGTVGNTQVTNGGTLIGAQGQTLTVDGDLGLSSGANVNVTLGVPGNSTGLFNVNGNLTLNGTLNVTSAGGFGAGVYRIIDYTGSLTDNGLDVGTMPAGNTATVQTAVANQVNLLVSGAASDTQFWNGTTTTADGTLHGGNGSWVVGPTNWTDLNGASANAWGSKFAVFQNNPGIVTVDNQAGAVTTTGMQFIGDGWRVGGQALTLDGSGAAGTTSIRVGDGTAAGANWTTTIEAELTGSSLLVKNDLGTLILTGANSYTGGTAIAAGTLQIGDGGTTGSISGIVDNAGTLAFNRSNSYTFGGQIVGTGAIRQIGSGLTNLTGSSSAFTGTTTVENGILAVNGQLGGALDIWTGGRLQGTGTVGNTVVSGVIAPGNSIGTLSVAGNITFNTGSIYEVEVNAAGQADRINATGTATINGGTVQVLADAGNYAPQTQYTILSATAGRTGTFAGVTSNLAFLDPALSYDANNVYLTMTRNGTLFQNVGITPNQIATGSGVESLGLGNPVYDAVLNLSAPQAQFAFDQLSGEIHASAKTAMIEDSRFIRSAVNDRLRAAFDGVGASGGNTVTYENGQPRAVAANTDGLAVWGQGFGSWGHWNSDGNAARLNRSIGGFFVGADAPVFDTWRFGAVAGYSRSSFDVKDRHSSGTSDTYHVGLYGGTAWGDLAFRTGAAYTWHDLSMARSVNFPGFGNSLTEDYNAATTQVFGELGYKMQAGNVALEPFANLAYVNLHTDGFTEKGGAAALTSGSANTDATFTTLGLRASSSFDLNGVAVTAKGMLGWRHAFGDVTPNTTMRFASGGDAFSIGGVPIARNAAVVEAGLDFALSSTATFGVTYGGQFGSGITDQTFRANFNVKF